MSSKRRPEKSYLEAKEAAQRLAFGPLAFQAIRILSARGILTTLHEAGDEGRTLPELEQTSGLTRYALEVLLESALVSDVVELLDLSAPDAYRLSKTGYFFVRDAMTRVNVDFVHEVCYRAMSHLEQSLLEQRPAGLRELGPWPTVYEGLAELAPAARKAWFAFDHFYSDGVFHHALPIIFDRSRSKVLDVGGNTGRFAHAVLQHSPTARVTIVDLPGQLRSAEANLTGAEGNERVSYVARNVLDASQELPQAHDVIWMSQFLDCFSEVQIVSILERARRSIALGGELFILETFWDRTAVEAARYVVAQTSLYFSAVANGNSKMYHSRRFLELIAQAGWRVTELHDGLGSAHTLVRCVVS
jgi:hypothetical protein